MDKFGIALCNPICDFIKEIISYTNNDERHVKRNTIIQIIIATIAFVLLIRVYPMGVMRTHEYSKQQALDITSLAEIEGDDFSTADKKLQKVYFLNEHLYQVKLYMSCDADTVEAKSQHILFRLYNKEFSCIYEEEYICKDIVEDRYLLATPDIDVVLNDEYYYEILIPEETMAGFVLPIANKAKLAQSENSTLFIDGIINDEMCLVADFDYSNQLTTLETVFYYFLIVFGAFAIYILIMCGLCYLDERFECVSDKAYRLFKRITTIVLLAVTVFGIVYSVILNKFGGDLPDRIFYLVACVVAFAWANYAIQNILSHNDTKKTSKLPVNKRASLIWRNYIQVLSFGLLFYALCQYVNADRNYYHYTNTRWMLIFLAIALLMIYTEKQFVNKLSIIWLGLGAIGSYLYCSGFEANDKELAALTSGVVVSWGLLIINILLNIDYSFAMRRYRFICVIKKILNYANNHKLQVVYSCLWIMFCIFMYVYRYEKIWVFTATLPFVPLLIIKMTDSAKSRLLKNFTNGILLSFGFVTLFCLIHRPYHYWMLYRYNGIFHTVACTGMYLAVVFGAAIAKLYGKLKDYKGKGVYREFKRCYKELFITSMVIGFVVLTMSRTAMLSVFVCFVCTMLLSMIAYKKKILNVVAEVGMLIFIVALSFPLVFSMVRVVPAIINDPVRYSYEFTDRAYIIYEGDPIDSDKYMTVKRFFSCLIGRFETESTDSKANAANFIDKENQQLLVYTGDDFAGIDILNSSVEAEVDVEEEKADISNGRFDIFIDYIKSSSLSGNPRMGPIEKDGNEYAHAHNSYLQVAYNFGIIAGGIFLLICIISLGRAIKLFCAKGSTYGIYLVPFSLIIVFGFVSLTEWAFHPCIPAGFCFLFVQAFLIRD